MPQNVVSFALQFVLEINIYFRILRTIDSIFYLPPLCSCMCGEKCILFGEFFLETLTQFV